MIAQNSPPTATCQDIVLPAEAGTQCQAGAAESAAAMALQVGAKSVDPDGDTLTYTLDQSSSGPYELGENPVTLVVSDGELQDTCEATIIVTDDEEPVVDCGTIGVIAPCEEPVSGSFGIVPKSNGCTGVTVTAVHDGCLFCNGAGKTKTRDECDVSTEGPSFNIAEAGGVASHIIFTVTATNDNAGASDEFLEAQATCTVCTQNPSVDFNPGCSDSKPSKSKGFECGVGFPVSEFTCDDQEED